MSPFLYPISVKGVLVHGGKYLLRKNEREEWELLGGKFESSDVSLEERLGIEFLEESGIRAAVRQPLEPWVYTIGIRDILILPFSSEAVYVPPALSDMDGGQLAWFTRSEVGALKMPEGYVRSIDGEIPVLSFSATLRQQAKTFPDGCEVEIRLEYEGADGSRDTYAAPLEGAKLPRTVAIDLAKAHGKSPTEVVFRAVSFSAPRQVAITYGLWSDQ